MTHNIRDLLRTKTNSIRTSDKSELSEVYLAARELEVQQLAERMARILGSGHSEDFVTDVAVKMVDLANKARR